MSTLEEVDNSLRQSQDYGPPPSTATSLDTDGGGPLPSPSSAIHKIPMVLSSRAPSTDAGTGTEENTMNMNSAAEMEVREQVAAAASASTGEIFLPPNFKSTDCIPSTTGKSVPIKPQTSESSLGGFGERAVDLGDKLFIYGGYRDKFLYLFGSQISSEAKRRDFTMFLRTSGILQLISKFILGLQEMEFRPPPEQAIESLLKATGSKLVIRDILQEMEAYRDKTKQHIEQLQKEADGLRLRLEKYSTVFNPYEALDPDDFSDLATKQDPDSDPNPFEWLAPRTTVPTSTKEDTPPEVEVIHLAKSKSKTKSKKGKKKKKDEDDEGHSKSKKGKGKKTPKNSPSTPGTETDAEEETPKSKKKGKKPPKDTQTDDDDTKSKSKKKKGKNKPGEDQELSESKSKTKKKKKDKPTPSPSGDEAFAKPHGHMSTPDVEDNDDDDDVDVVFTPSMMIRRPRTEGGSVQVSDNETELELPLLPPVKEDLDLVGLFQHFRTLPVVDTPPPHRNSKSSPKGKQVGGGGDCGNLPVVEVDDEGGDVSGGVRVGVKLPPLLLTELRKYNRDTPTFLPPPVGQTIKHSN